MLNAQWREWSSPSYPVGALAQLVVLGYEIDVIPYHDLPGEPVKGFRVMAHEPGMPSPTVLAECAPSQAEGKKTAETWVLNKIQQALRPGSMPQAPA